MSWLPGAEGALSLAYICTVEGSICFGTPQQPPRTVPSCTVASNRQRSHISKRQCRCAPMPMPMPVTMPEPMTMPLWLTAADSRSPSRPLRPEILLLVASSVMRFLWNPSRETQDGGLHEVPVWLHNQIQRGAEETDSYGIHNGIVCYLPPDVRYMPAYIHAPHTVLKYQVLYVQVSERQG
jgi:hypothetical protein